MAIQHLKAEEREVISQMFVAGKSRSQIAKALGRHHSTIGRELRRNGYKGLYVAVDAQRCAKRRCLQGRVACRKMNRTENLAYVQKGLRQFWSPGQIAGRSQRDFPEDSRRRLSHTTIYTWINQDDHASRWQRLLRGYKRKRKPKKSEQRRGRALEKRPAIVNERGRVGDWEGDTIVGAGPHGGVFVSLVERRSRYTILLPLPNRKSDRVERSIRGRLQQLPTNLRRSITFDNGSEFAAFEALENALGLDVYFTDPHSPWQRGTNEYTNRLVRQFAPKGTSFRELSPYKVAKFERLLNDRPRKQLNYQTPNEVFQEACQRAIQT
jgi:IS30 family transposase